MDRLAGKGRLMAEETSHYAVVTDDEAGRQLAVAGARTPPDGARLPPAA